MEVWVDAQHIRPAADHGHGRTLRGLQPQKIPHGYTVMAMSSPGPTGTHDLVNSQGIVSVPTEQAKAIICPPGQPGRYIGMGCPDGPGMGLPVVTSAEPRLGNEVIQRVHAAGSVQRTTNSRS